MYAFQIIRIKKITEHIFLICSVSVCRKTYIIFKNGVWGVAPSGVRAAAPHSAPARMPGVYAQGLCTMQSQPSIHSLSPGERGLGIGIENKHFFEKTDFFYKLTARKGCFVLPVAIRAVPQYLRRDVSKERDSFLHRIPFLYQL